MKDKRIKKLATMSVLVAVSVVLVSLIHFPLLPAVSFLEYDPADIAILICGFSFGPVAGLCVTLAAALVQGLTVSASGGLYGILMHVIATGMYVSVSSLLYKRNRTRKGAVVGIICGAAAMTLIMLPANLLITPAFMGSPVEAVLQLLPLIGLFNLLKAGINGIITFLIYKKISRLIHSFTD